MLRKITAIVLAAGLSRRMGQQKLLLPWGSTSVIQQVLSTYLSAGVDEIIVVTGGSRQIVENEIHAMREPLRVRCVYNPDHEKGEMLSSLQCGLAEIVDSTAILVALGDQPQISKTSIEKVIESYELTCADLIVPSYNNKRGHPWLAGKSTWANILQLQSGQTLRDFLNEHNENIVYVETDSTILKDLDTPEQYQIEKP